MRLIDADALFYKLYNTNPATEGHFGDGVVQAMGFILNAPTIDAVPVVRCKDCKHFKKMREIEGVSWTGFCKYGGFHSDTDDFCSRGERKENV